MLRRLESISSGDLLIGEQQVSEVAPKDRGIAMVFQRYALSPHMTVAENLGFGLKLRGASKAEIAGRVGSRPASRPASRRKSRCWSRSARRFINRHFSAQAVVARCQPQELPPPGSPLPLRLARGSLHFFDPGGGNRLQPGSARL